MKRTITDEAVDYTPEQLEKIVEEVSRRILQSGSKRTVYPISPKWAEWLRTNIPEKP